MKRGPRQQLLDPILKPPAQKSELKTKTSRWTAEDPAGYLGDGLLQPVEGVDHGHVPPLALGQRADDLAGVALSAQLRDGAVRTLPQNPLGARRTLCPGTDQLLRLDAEELDGLGGVLCDGQRQAGIHRRHVQLAAATTTAAGYESSGRGDGAGRRH